MQRFSGFFFADAANIRIVREYWVSLSACCRALDVKKSIIRVSKRSPAMLRAFGVLDIAGLKRSVQIDCVVIPAAVIPSVVILPQMEAAENRRLSMVQEGG